MRRVLEKCEQVRALLTVLDAGEGHLIAGDDMLGIGDPRIEVLSFHTTPDDFTASEKRAKLTRSPAFRFHSPDRLGPVMLLSGSNE